MTAPRIEVLHGGHLSGGSPREGARTREARQQRLAAGGPQGSPDTYYVLILEFELVKAVADAGSGDHVAGIARLGLDLLAQAGDVYTQ
jgi:hypothetical protein